MKEDEVSEERFRRELSKARSIYSAIMQHMPEHTTPLAVHMRAIEAQVHNEALVGILITKGICTLAEFREAVVVAAQEEVEWAREQLAQVLGVDASIIILQGEPIPGEPR